MDKINLTQNEKRDIIRYIESGKALPDTFRFLLFADKKEVELVWNGKTTEVSNVVLPFQTIEVVDEPREEKKAQLMLFESDERGRQNDGWTNKLIWGDNKLILSSLKSGAMREEIEKQGGIKLIYIDPPFDVGADFSMKVEIGDEELTKKPNVLEELAYRDTWGHGADSFIAMIYERLSLMRDLLTDDGSMYVHCDWRLNSSIKLILDEIFGADNLINEIVWKRRGGKTSPDTNRMENVVDYILFYAKNKSANEVNFQFTKEDSENYIKTQFKYEDANGRKYRISPLNAPKPRPTLIYDFMGYKPHPNGWSVKKETLQKFYDEGKLVFPKKEGGRVNRKQYLDEWEGYAVNSLWTDIPVIGASSGERVDYPTQKPEKLLERIIKASSNKGDLIADFFCGSGTTLAVAEKLGRKWIGSDLGKFAIHTTRKRMISVQREMKENEKDFRAFEILNLGKYERQHYIGLPAPRQYPLFYIYVIKCEHNSFYIGQTDNLPRRWKQHQQGRVDQTKRHKPLSIIHYETFQAREDAVKREKELKTGFGRKWLKREYEKGDLEEWDEDAARQASINPNLREEQKQKQMSKKEKDFRKLIIRAYKAEPIANFKTFIAKKAGRLVSIGPINLPASRNLIEEVIKECIEKQISKVDILSFEFEMGLFPKIQQEAKDKGIDLALKYIPREVFDKRAVEKNQIQFHDVSYIEVKPHIKDNTIAVELTDFSVYYNQDIKENVEASLKNNTNKISVEQGNIIKISKDSNGIVKREVLTKHWTDWIDYWAVDFDFESKEEIVHIKNEKTGKCEAKWTGNYVFENEWQSFRTKKDRSIELKSISHECQKGRRKIAVKVVDIFGNDTMKVIEVNI